MHICRVTIAVVALLSLVAGCKQRDDETPTPATSHVRDSNEWYWKAVTEANQLRSKADVVFTTEGARAEHAVRLMHLAPATTNDLVSAPDFQSALASVPGRQLALIEMYAFGFNTNRLTNAAAQLRQCGFRDVRALVLGWGGRFLGPAL